MESTVDPDDRTGELRTEGRDDRRSAAWPRAELSGITGLEMSAAPWLRQGRSVAPQLSDVQRKVEDASPA